jgi:hypothetical protein
LYDKYCSFISNIVGSCYNKITIEVEKKVGKCCVRHLQYFGNE